jgi:hypothetical protein
MLVFNRKAILRQQALLPLLWREPLHDLAVLRAKDRRQELCEQIIATIQGNSTSNEFVAIAAEKVAELPLEERRAAAWQHAHILVVRAILARKLLE